MGNNIETNHISDSLPMHKKRPRFYLNLFEASREMIT